MVIDDKTNTIILTDADKRKIPLGAPDSAIGNFNGLSFRLIHNASKIIHITSDGKFIYLKNRNTPKGEFIPTKEEKEKIFEELI